MFKPKLVVIDSMPSDRAMLVTGPIIIVWCGDRYPFPDLTAFSKWLALKQVCGYITKEGAKDLMERVVNCLAADNRVAVIKNIGDQDA